jgi:hypothetical protein
MKAHRVAKRLDSRLTDGGVVVSLTRRPKFTPWYLGITSVS